MKKNWPIDFASQNIHHLYGHSTSEFVTREVQYIDLIHPDDLARVAREVKDFLTTNRECFTHEPYRLICINGEVIWVSDQSNARKNVNGEVTHFEGTLQNISEQLIETKKLVHQSDKSQEKLKKI